MNEQRRTESETFDVSAEEVVVEEIMRGDHLLFLSLVTRQSSRPKWPFRSISFL